jgi:hypothetical protein
MLALDSFISPIPGFEGGITILPIPVLDYPPGGESIKDPAARSSVGALKTRAGK